MSEHLAVLERRGVDGIILFAFNDLDYAAMASLREKLVLMARERAGFSSVCFDDDGRCAPCSPTSGTVADRGRLSRGGAQRSHHRAASASGLPLTTVGNRGRTARSALGDPGLQSGYRLAAELLTPPPRPWSAPATPWPSAP